MVILSIYDNIRIYYYYWRGYCYLSRVEKVGSTMDITKERSRLIFTNYTREDQQNIEKLVSTMDKIFTYTDEDKRAIYLPPGMETSIRKTFPRYPIEDRSKDCWPAAKAAPEAKEHFEPRNELQKDTIKFALEHANHNRKVGFINSPG